jgi:hypothetical protein
MAALSGSEQAFFTTHPGLRRAVTTAFGSTVRSRCVGFAEHILSPARRQAHTLTPFAKAQDARLTWPSTLQDYPTTNARHTNTNARLLTRRALRLRMHRVTAKVEPLQQPVRKAVGRPATERQRLVCVEELVAFVNKYAPGSLKRVEGDRFPVRKAVGRPRPSGH